MKAPDIAAIKKEIGLPDEVLFRGYLFYNPDKDDFLCRYRSNDCGVFSEWTPFPENAMRFATYHKAEKIFKRLEYENKCIIVLLFFVDDRYCVAFLPCECDEAFSEMVH